MAERAGALHALAAVAIGDEQVVHLPVRAGAARVRRAHEHDGLGTDADGEMRRPRVAADDGGRLLEEVGELFEVQLADEVDGRDVHLGRNLGGLLRFDGTAADEHRNDAVVVEPVAEHGKVPVRPAFCRPAGADDEHDIGVVHIGTGLGDDLARQLLFALGHADRQAYFPDRTADGARRVEVALDDVVVAVRPDDGLRDEFAALAHIPHAVLLSFRGLGERGDGRRLEETLQVEHGVVVARLYLLAQRREVLQEAAEAAEFLLLKDDDLVDAGGHHDDVVGWRLDDPGQVGFRVRLLDGVAHGQGVDDIADGAHLHDQDILHSAISPPSS